MLGIGAWDWVTLGVYFAVITTLGIWAARRVSDTNDFFMAGRRFGKAFMVFFAFGAGTSGNDAVGVSSKTFTSGVSGIWWQWLWLFCTPFYWLIAPVMRRMRCLTTGDYFEERYDGSVAALYSLVGVIQLTVTIGVIQLGAGSMIEGVTGGAIPKEYAIIGMTILFVVYGMAGGLAAAIVTDFIQGILTVVLSFILLPFALQAAGGFAGLHRHIDDPAMFSLVAPGEINGFYITMLCLSALVGIVTQPHIMGVCAAGRTEMDGRVGFAGGNLLKRFCTIPWTIVGLCGIVMYAGQSINPDQIYGQVASDLLPAVMPGLIGIFLAALIASVMSSCDAFMVSSSGLFTQNFYRRWLVREHSEAHYVFVGRIAALVIVLIGISFAFIVEDVPSGLLWFFKLQALMGAAFWIGLFWRRATVAGAWTATLVGLAVLFVTSQGAFHEWAAGKSHTVRDSIVAAAADRAHQNRDDVARALDAVPFTLREVAAHFEVTVEDIVSWTRDEGSPVFADGYDPLAPLPLDKRLTVSAPNLPRNMIWQGRFRDSWQIFFYLTGGFLAAIVVSLFTRRVPEARLDRVYACLHTPVHESETHQARPFSLPEGMAPTPPRKLINHPDFEIPVPTRVGMLGFAFFWAWVVLLIWFMFWMVTWGK